MINKIYLTGFMGSGKSTIGPILANTLGWDFFDLDKVIEVKEGKKVSKIFEESGEEYFRELEEKTLEELSEKENFILALGGGTVTSQANIDLMKKKGKIIYLKISPESAYKRLRFKRDRPVLTRDDTVNLDRNEFVKKISELLNARKKFYEQADLTIDTNNLPMGILVDQIAKLIQSKK
ncbi:MAG: shikimate kinase [Bacteroidetes bacterium]|nr:shikimate kinase [Bacteroidota bacterium]